MKKAFTKFIVLSAMLLLAVSSAFAQGKGGSDYAQKETSPRGDEWEVIVFGDKKYDYFKGSDLIDGFRSNSRARLGFHWKGHRVSEVESDTLYLCNVATGEYLQIGDYWGETGMVNQVGLPYILYKETSRPIRPTFTQTGYWFQPVGVREDRVIGRMNVNDGLFGHFEYNKFLALRYKDEYHDGVNDGGHPGGFFFEFHEVEGEKGEVEYIIYTHRQTNRDLNSNGDLIKSEYYNRDSYLLLTNAGKVSADYNAVRFVKFAGQMYGADKPTVAIAQKGTDITTLGSFSPSNTAASTFTANLALSNETTVPVTVTADGEFMGVSNADGNDNYLNALGFYPADGNVHTITVSAPEGYVIKSYALEGLTWTSGRKFIVKAGDVTKTIGSGNGTNLTEIKKDDFNSRTMTFTIQVDPEATASETWKGLYFTNFNVVLERTGAGDSNVVPLYSNDEWNESLGDEKKNYDQGKYFISLDDGLTEAAKDKNNRWKLVTKKERDRFRLVASETQPADMSSKIVNPKFYTSFNYNWAKEVCSGPDAEGHYTHPNEDTEFGWQWFDRDTETHPSGHHHVHPYNIDYSGHWDNKQEHHKVGTGHFWRTGHEGTDVNAQEFMMTEGQEANYCGSIFKGSANIQQKITGLREGLYVVYVRGFYAPHDMTQYTIADWNDLSASNGDKMGENNTNTKAPNDWFNEARVKIGEEWMWRRSHDSYLFAWSYPKGKKGLNDQNVEIDLPAQEVRRMLPSIYEGAIRHNQLGKISKYNFVNCISDSTFLYTQLGLWNYHHKYADGRAMTDAAIETVNAQMYLVKDENLFARYKGTFFDTGADAAYNWVVPKTVTGAGRFFNAVDAMSESDQTSTDDTHKNASNYRIGLPVYVGPDGELVIGVDHSKVDGSFDNEWVCFDDFELLYMGKVEPDEFVIDELEGTKKVGPFEEIDGNSGTPKGTYSEKTDMKNNTQWIDLFDPTDIAHGTNVTTVKKVVLRRTMPKGWSSIVLPVSLTLKHVKEMFGENANVSKLDKFEGRVIHYKNQLEGKGEDDIVMQAGIPYIVRPSKDPDIEAGSDFKYNRPVFTKAYSTSANGVAGWYLKNDVRNAEVERSLEGPIWIATDVTINSGESFPKVAPGQTNNDNGDVWTEITGYEANFVIQGDETNETYTMKETAVYEPGGFIPANSYYHAAGKMYYTTTRIPKTGGLPRGLYSYIQMIREKDGKAYAKPFIGGSDTFIEVIDEPTGIEDINRPLPDGKIEIYDLQGRKVTNPGRGIYIMNGQKVLFK
ncbi:hypothetical protein [Prevotella sp. Rep29]|uniref:hypothetical protein n=1 Tax=Prevotella sp. Rep29 TaxID=2691580 RepID=UPI001C6DDC80|nr:hypothetical protein [Prevotella sp. Rep29]QYR11454.1 hypothetical protein GRF55_10355 [Prevotella sp. Rep29]